MVGRDPSLSISPARGGDDMRRRVAPRSRSVCVCGASRARWSSPRRPRRRAALIMGGAGVFFGALGRSRVIAAIGTVATVSWATRGLAGVRDARSRHMPISDEVAVPPLRIISANVLKHNLSYAELAAEVQLHRPDVVVTLETTARWKVELSATVGARAGGISRRRGDGEPGCGDLDGATTDRDHHDRLRGRTVAGGALRNDRRRRPHCGRRPRAVPG